VLSEKTLNTLADRAEPELLGGEFMEWHPETLRRIVTGTQFRGAGHLAAEEEVEGGDGHPGVEVLIGETEEIAGLGYAKACLLEHLAGDAFLGRLSHVGETAGQVERALGRRVLSALHQQFSLVVEDEGHGGPTGVEVIHESAMWATAAFHVIVAEAIVAANWAV
jgi:hypothetical protein